MGSATAPGRNVCGRATRQTRSYFALKLPNNWWLCAWDVQLDGFIDQTQISFFEYVAQEIMDEGSNIILCVGQPVWAYCKDETIPEFRNFAFASLIVSGGFRRLDHRGRGYVRRPLVVQVDHREQDGVPPHSFTDGLGVGERGLRQFRAVERD